MSTQVQFPLTKETFAACLKNNSSLFIQAHVRDNTLVLQQLDATDKGMERARVVTNALFQQIQDRAKEGLTSTVIHDKAFFTKVTDHHCRECTKATFQCATKILNRNAGITITKGKGEHTLSWSLSNPVLKPVYVRPTQTKLERHRYFETLLASRELADMQIVVEGKSIPVHRCILAQASFLAEKCMPGAQIVLTDYKKDLVEAVLSYLYVGKISDQILKKENAAFMQMAYSLRCEPLKVYLRGEMPLAESQVDLRQGYFADLCSNELHADVYLKVGEETVPAHRCILAQVPYFKNAFTTGNWKESVETTLPIEGFSVDVVKALLFYVYKGTITSTFFENGDDLAELLRLADYMGYDCLKHLCLAQMNQRISEDNFLPIATTSCSIKDEHLEELCRWFARAYPNFGEELELEQIDYLTLISMHIVGKKFKLINVAQNALTQLKATLKLDDNFIRLCQCILDKKDKESKKCLQELMKADKSLYEKLVKGRTGDYQKHWDAYALICTNPDI